jgi:hypothetical protein
VRLEDHQLGIRIRQPFPPTALPDRRELSAPKIPIAGFNPFGRLQGIGLRDGLAGPRRAGENRKFPGQRAGERIKKRGAVCRQHTLLNSSPSWQS